MKLNRHKRFRRILRFYKVNYHLEAPYTIVVDSEFIQAALNGKIHIKEQLPKILQDKCYPKVTGCTIQALRSKGEQYSGAQLIAKRFDRIHCSHTKPVAESECIATTLKGESLGTSVCVGMQDIDLRARVRFQLPRVPIFYIMGQVPILEEPACVAKGIVKEQATIALQPSAWEQKALGLEHQDENKPSFKPKRKRKEPNPLSCKKKRKREETATNVSTSSLDKTKKTRRKRRASRTSQSLPTTITSN